MLLKTIPLKKVSLRYLAFLFVFLNPLSLFSCNTVFKSRSQNSSIVAMAVPGDLPSKLTNDTSTPKESCRQVTQTEYHEDGSKTITTTITYNKREKYDENGQLTKKTDTSSQEYQCAQKHFFGFPTAGSSSQKK